MILIPHGGPISCLSVRYIGGEIRGLLQLLLGIVIVIFVTFTSYNRRVESGCQCDSMASNVKHNEGSFTLRHMKVKFQSNKKLQNSKDLFTLGHERSKSFISFIRITQPLFAH